MPTQDTVEEAAAALYALPPEEFVAARDAAAKAASDSATGRAIRAMRKPTVSAYVMNSLAHQEAELLGSLLELGDELAAAQRGGAGDELRRLGEQRRQLVAAVTARAFEVARRAPTAAVRGEVESTLEAALADRASGQAVQSGTLTRALSYAGFGTVDLEGAVAVAPARARQEKPRAGSKAPVDRARELERQVQQAAGELDDAVRLWQHAQDQHAEAEQGLLAATDAARAAEQALADARAARAEAEHAERATARAVEKAAARVAAAQATADKARRAFDRVARG